MQAYRSTATSLAVQYTGEPIPDVTCGGSSPDETIRHAARQLNGCDPSRAHMPHVHTAEVGGLGVVTPGCWIMPVRGGPFCVVEDAQFRAHFEVPEPVTIESLEALLKAEDGSSVSILPDGTVVQEPGKSVTGMPTTDEHFEVPERLSDQALPLLNLMRSMWRDIPGVRPEVLATGNDADTAAEPIDSASADADPAKKKAGK